HKRNRRLYRDPDHRMIGGVCGGLGAYFNIDPVILRLVLAALVLFSSSWFFFSGGTVILIYLLLWVVVPSAKTTAQKLEMRGEDINISNIEKSIKDEYNEVKETFHKFRSSAAYTKGREKMDQLGEVAHSGIGFLLKIFVIVVGILLIITGIISLVGISLGSFTGYQDTTHWYGHFNFTSMFNVIFSKGETFWAWLGILLAIGIPVLMMIYVGTKLLFKFRANNLLIGLSALGTWLAGIIILFIITIGQIGNFKERIGQTKNETIQTNSNVIYLSMNDQTYEGNEENLKINLNGMRVLNTDNGRFLAGKPKLNIEKSDNNNVYLTLYYTSKGKSEADARKNLKNIIYSYSSKDSTILFNHYFTLLKNCLWRDQNLKMTLKIPVGKTIYLSDNMIDIIYDIKNVTNTQDNEMIGKYWVMTEDGLKMRDTTTETETETDNE
ncbi:MAG: PspC domain-containing protein, partial [Bacteroidota bacterium]|nr:PspC domain-containing protein [Bacteroidota bacterium]